MSTTHTTTTKKRAPVPLLLESFPAPPSHIPPTPTTASPNPPPTGPPCVPLPPLPGPSRISEHEQFLLLSSVTNRSRRSSKYSVASSRRESVISLAGSVSGHGGRSPAFASSPLPMLPGSPSQSNRDSVASSSRSSPRSPSSLGRPSISVSHSSHGHSHGYSPPQSGNEQQLTRMSMSPMPLSDIEDDDDAPRDMPSPLLPRASLGMGMGSPRNLHLQQRKHQANESISSIDMRDVLRLEEFGYSEADEDQGGDDDILPPSLLGFSSSSSRSPPAAMPTPHRNPYHHNHHYSIADPIDPGMLSNNMTNSRPPTSPVRRGFGGSYSYPSPSKHSPVHSIASISTFTPSSPPATPTSASAPIAAISTTTTIATTPTSTRSPTHHHRSLSNSRPKLPAVLEADTAFTSQSPTLISSSSSTTSMLVAASTSASTLTSSTASISKSPLPTSSPTASSPYTPISSSPLPQSPPAQMNSPTARDLHMEMRASRSTSEGHKRILGGRSRSRGLGLGMAMREGGMPPPTEPLPVIPGGLEEKTVLGAIVVTKTTTTKVEGKDEMTLDELTMSSTKTRSGSTSSVGGAGLPPASYSTRTAKSSSSSKTPTPKTKEEDPRAPSPDILSILSSTPRPALGFGKSLSNSAAGRKASLSRSRSRARVKSGSSVVAPLPSNAAAGVGVGTGVGKRRVSEGAVLQSRQSQSQSQTQHGKKQSMSELAYLRHRNEQSIGGVNSLAFSDDLEGEGGYDEAMERVLEGQGSEDEDVGAGAGAGYGYGFDGAKEVRGRARGPGRGREMLGKGRVGAKKEEEDEDGGSDSSLDLHTPLPHLMVRHGLLSPNSKLLPQETSRSSTPHGSGFAPPDGRPGSIVSVMSAASAMTKSGVVKDERDTPNRRVRHRDGRLLRGGIGLTTGLGWSDSEDEDAPSPLTRRLSTLNLSRRSSASSAFPSTSKRLQHPLSRSYSSGALLDSERNAFDEYDEFDDDELDHSLQHSGAWAQAHRHRGPLSSSTPAGSKSPPTPAMPPPPTSWQRRPPQSQRSSVGTSGTGGARTSTSSVGSHFSLEVTIPEGERAKTPSRLRRPSAGAAAAGAGLRDSGGSSLDRQYRSMGKRPSGDESSHTPSSTTSTMSIPMPVTPVDGDSATPTPKEKKRQVFDKEKSLPPLPSGLKKTASGSTQRAVSSATTTTSIGGGGKYAFPRARTFSSASAASASTPSRSPPTGPPSMASTPATSPHVRPLQLPRQTTRVGGDRPAVPVPLPTPLTSSASYASLRTPSLPSSAPPSPLPSSASPGTPTFGTAMAKPKPRTGTGMSYRTSSYSSMGSKMRAPMVLTASTSAAGGGGGGAAGAAASIGRAGGGVPRAIAL
ncbi:hypothetical protein B0H34DRAFT_802925 [Crassisporium funariophilum]|nr:hypothetical protein B0H34DRAFT_802925 [Crassisporium funariophilum]